MSVKWLVDVHFGESCRYSCLYSQAEDLLKKRYLNTDPCQLASFKTSESQQGISRKYLNPGQGLPKFLPFFFKLDSISVLTMQLECARLSDWCGSF